jgi:hypothetical protein
MAADAQKWPNLIFEKLREFDVRHVTYVPDSGHARLIELCHAADDMKPTMLTTEEEGTASWPAPGSAASAVSC